MSTRMGWYGWCCCLVLAGSLVLGACDDSEPNTTTDTGTDVTGGDTTGTDTTDCCTAAECAASGQLCNTTTCVCEDDTGTGCQAVNDACDPAAAQPANFVCADDGAGGGVCRQACDTTSPCPSGSYCTGGQPGFCQLSECDGFFANNCTASDSKCVPALLAGFDGNANVCIPNGTGGDGASCTSSSDCMGDFICLAVSDTAAECQAPDCSPLDTTQECSTGQTCSGLSSESSGAINIGFCYTDCDVFGDSSECDTGEACFPTERGSDNAIDGLCLEGGGTTAVGDPCQTAAECIAGSICLGNGDGTANCRAFCDPMAAVGETGACPGTDFCTELATETTEFDYGACIPTCEAWTDDPIAAGCESGEWCQPSFEQPEGLSTAIGFCQAAGTGAPEDQCAATSAQADGGSFPSCGADTICLIASVPDNEGASCSADSDCTDESGQAGTCFGGTCQAKGECTSICDPNGEGASEPGFEGCTGPTDACLPLATSETTFDVGSCNPACSNELDIACLNSAETCVEGVLFGLGTDLCFEDVVTLDERANCTDAGVDSFICGDLSICTDLSPSPLQSTAGDLCYELCRFNLPAEAASASIGTGDNGMVMVVANTAGAAGNAWSVIIQSTNAGTADSPLAVTLQNTNEILIELAIDSAGAVDATADGGNAASAIAAAINANTDLNTAVTATASGTGSDAISATGTTALAGGVDAKGSGDKGHPDCTRPKAICTGGIFVPEFPVGVCGIEECLNSGTSGCLDNADCCSNTCTNGICE